MIRIRGLSCVMCRTGTRHSMVSASIASNILTMLQRPASVLCIALCAIGLLPGCVWITPGCSKPIPGYSAVYEIEGAPLKALSDGMVLVMAGNRKHYTLVHVEMHEASDVLRLPRRKAKTVSGTWAMFPLLLDGVFLYKGEVINADRTILSPLVPGYVPLAPDGMVRMGAWWISANVDEAYYISQCESKERRIFLTRASPEQEAEYLRDLLTVDLEINQNLDAASQEAIVQAKAYALDRLRELQIPLRELQIPPWVIDRELNRRSNSER